MIVDWKISLIKGVKALVIFAASAGLSYFLQMPEATIPLGAVATAVVNYITHWLA